MTTGAGCNYFYGAEGGDTEGEEKAGRFSFFLKNGQKKISMFAHMEELSGR